MFVFNCKENLWIICVGVIVVMYLYRNICDIVSIHSFELSEMSVNYI
jgi:hypothetical protein